MWYKAEFSASLLQSLVSYDPSEIILILWFAAQRRFPIIIIYVETSKAQHVFIYSLHISHCSHFTKG